jgi:hypothetical protein
MHDDAHHMFTFLFGTKQFIPLMSIVQRWFPSSLFAALGYEMFAFLFRWTDTQWDAQHKPAYFQFTPQPVSTRVLLHWAKIARHGRLVKWSPSPIVQSIRSRAFIPVYDEKEEQRYRGHSKRHSDVSDEGVDLQLLPNGTLDACRDSDSDEVYPLSEIKSVPLLLFWGAKDYLVNPATLVEELKEQANLMHAECIEHYEHMDFLWAKDARERVWEPLIRVWRRLDNEE